MKYGWLVIAITAASFLMNGCGDNNGSGSDGNASSVSSSDSSSSQSSSVSSSDSSSSQSSSQEATALVLNEFKANIPEDEHAKQYIELRGTPGTVIDGVYVVQIDGDEDEEGVIDYAYNLDGVTIGSNGLVIVKNADEYNDIPAETTAINDPAIRTYDPDVDGDEYEDGILEHDAVTYMLIRTTTALTRGDDLDTDNDGTLNLPADAEILDAVGNHDGGDGFVYTDVVLTQSASDPDAATRFYGDLTPSSLEAWANGDIYEDPSKEDDDLPGEVLYDTLQASSNLPPKAALTPGTHNFNKAPFVLLNEVVNTGDKYIELLSNASQAFGAIYLVTVTDDKGTAETVSDLGGNVAAETGITLIKDAAASIDTGSAITVITADLASLTSTDTSVLLIYSPDIAIGVGDDLDSDDDGRLDLPEGAILLDNIGWGETTYSDIVTGTTTTAIRYKDNRIVSLSAWNFEQQYATPANTNIAEAARVLVKPTLESARTVEENADADDVAFWIHPSDPQHKSLVIATQKIAGYSIYDVEGNTLKDFKPEDNRYNNVDVMYGFDLNGTSIDLAIFTDRIFNKFIVYKISETEPYLTDITDYANTDELFAAKKAGEDTAYGLAVYRAEESSSVTPEVVFLDAECDDEGEIAVTQSGDPAVCHNGHWEASTVTPPAEPPVINFYVYASQNDTNLYAQFKLKANGDKIGWEKVRTITLAADDDDKHAEGMVVDAEYGKLYISQEEVGIYVTDALGSDDTALGEDDLLIEEGDHGIVEDIEGATIYYKDNGEGYYMVSSQGNQTFGVFKRAANGVMNEYVTSFTVVDDMNGIDGAQETDSIDVTNISLGTKFAYGALILQDGIDTTSDPDDTGTNFKWIKWEDLAAGLGDESFDSSYDPRNPTNRR